MNLENRKSGKAGSPRAEEREMIARTSEMCSTESNEVVEQENGGKPDEVAEPLDNNLVDNGGKKASTNRNVTWKGVLCYGICALMGSHFTNWNIGFDVGFWEYIGIMLTIMIGFGCVMLCITEMTAALPFSGGHYGVVRVTLGDLPGYLIGTTETFQYIFNVAFNTVAIGSYVTAMTGYDDKHEPIYWAIVYALIIFILYNRKRLFWPSVKVLAAFICVIILLYCTMTREGANFNKYSRNTIDNDLTAGEKALRYFEYMPQGSWFFGGAAKIMPLACKYTVNPTENVPKAIYLHYMLAIVSGFCIVFSAASIAPGVEMLRKTRAPLAYGFAQAFGIAPVNALAFTLIAKFGTCLCYSFAYFTEMHSLSKSGFMWSNESFLCVPRKYNDLVSILTGSAIGYAAMIVIWFWNKDYRIYLVNCFMLWGSSINIVICVCYIVFRYKFRSLAKTYQSPLGIPGAVFGIIVMGIFVVSVGALQLSNHYLYFVLLLCFLFLWSIPYFVYYRHHVKYSQEESTILFVAYVIATNSARRVRRTRKLRCSPLATYSPGTADAKRKNTYSPKNMGIPEDSVVSQVGTEDQVTLQRMGGDLHVRQDEADLEMQTVRSSSTQPQPQMQPQSQPQFQPQSKPHPFVLTLPTTTTTNTQHNPTQTYRLPFMNSNARPVRTPPPLGGARAGGRDRVAPLHAPLHADTAESRTQRVEGLRSVLANEFQYDAKIVQDIQGEIEEFYDRSSSVEEELDDYVEEH